MKSGQLPFQLDISYSQSLQFKLVVREILTKNRFDRHTLILNSFSIEQITLILRKYIAYLSYGDYIKVKAPGINTRWYQKNSQTSFPYFDCKSIEKQKNTLQKYQPAALLSKAITDSNSKNYSQIQIFSIFLNQKTTPKAITTLNQYLIQKNIKKYNVNIFHSSFLKIKEIKLNLKKQVSFLKLDKFQQQLKYMFFSLKKISIRKMKIQLEIQNGYFQFNDINKKFSLQDWNQTDVSTIENQMFNLTASKNYIHSLFIRNLGYKESFFFKFKVQCTNSDLNQFESYKTFTLKPSRQFIHYSFFNEKQFTQTQVSCIYFGKQSLSADSNKQQRSLSSLKVLETGAFVQIKDDFGVEDQSINI